MAADVESKIRVDVSTTGALSSAAQLEKVATAENKVIKAEQKAAAVTDASKRKVSELVGATKALYNTLFAQAREFGANKSAASAFAKAVALAYEATLDFSRAAGKSEGVALRNAEATASMTAATRQVNGAVGALTLSFEKHIPTLTAVAVETNTVSTAQVKAAETAQLDAVAQGEDSVAKDKNTASTTRLSSALKNFSVIGKTVANIMHGVTNASITLNANFRRMYSTVRALMFTFLVFSGLIGKWFNLASGFAETNHMLYTVMASLHDGARAVTVLDDKTIHLKEAMQVLDEETGEVKETITDLAGTDDNLKHLVRATDMFGNALEDALYYDDAAIAQAFQSTIDYLEEIAYKMEIDPTKLKQTYAQFLGMAQSAGMAADGAKNLALGMTELTYDLASLWDVPFETAAQRMRSALAGITRAVQQFGLDVSKASMDAWLLNKGIAAHYNTLSRADKMMAIYIKMLEDTSAAQGDLARSALQPANLLRFLKDQATLAARQLGAAIFPVLTAVIPLFIHAAQAVQRFAASLSSFLGIKLGGWYSDAVADWNSYLSNLGGGLGNLGGDIEDIADDADDATGSLGSAAKAAKDFKKQLLGFDEINNLTETEDKTGGSGGGGGAGIDWSQYLTADIWSQWEGNVRTQIDKAAADIHKALTEAFDGKFGEGSFERITFWLRTLRKALFNLGVEGNTARAIFENQFGQKVIPIQEHLAKVWQRLKDLMGLTGGDAGDFVKSFVSGIAEVIDGVQKFIDKLLDAIEWMKRLWDGDATTESTGKFIGKLVTMLALLGLVAPILGPIGTAIAGAFAGFDRLTGIIANLKIATGETEALGTAIAKTGDAVEKAGKSSWLEKVGGNLKAKGGGSAIESAVKSGGVRPGLSSAELAGKSASETLGALSKATEAAKAESSLFKIGTLLEGIPSKIGAIKTAFSGLSVLGKLNIITTVVTVFIEMLKNSPLLRGSLKSAFEAIGHALSVLITIFDTINDILAPVYAIAGNILGVLISAASVILDFGVSLIEWLVTPLQALGNILVNVTAGLQEGWEEGWQGIWDSITGAFESVLTWIRNLFGIHSPSTVMAEIGEDLLLGMEEGVDDGEPTLLDKVWTFITNLLGGIIDKIAEFLPTLPGKILGFLEAHVFPHLPGILNNVLTFIIKLGADIIGMIWTWIKTLPGQIVEWCGILWNKLNEVLGGWPQKVLDIGKNIVTGIWNGISGAWQWLKDKVTGLFGGLVSGIKKTLGIASPSKVFAEMGGWSMEGFGVGFDDEYTVTLNRMVNTTDNIVQAVTQELVGIPELTSAQLNSMGDVVGTSVTLQANAALQSQNNDLLTASQTEIGLLREQNGLLAQLLEKEFGVSLDGNMLAASINKASRVQGRPLVWA